MKGLKYLDQMSRLSESTHIVTHSFTATTSTSLLKRAFRRTIRPIRPARSHHSAYSRRCSCQGMKAYRICKAISKSRISPCTKYRFSNAYPLIPTLTCEQSKVSARKWLGKMVDIDRPLWMGVCLVDVCEDEEDGEERRGGMGSGFILSMRPSLSEIRLLPNHRPARRG